MARSRVPGCTAPDTTAGIPTRDERLIRLSRQPWTIQPDRTDRRVLLVRPSTIRDLHAVAAMHHRCSARSLLDRYRRGGRPPAVAALDLELRNPFAVVAVDPRGNVVATASIEHDRGHGSTSAVAGLLVEDRWQRRYIGTELLLHLAGVARAAGFEELISYPATAVGVAKHMVVEVGRTRCVPGGNTHLHTVLPDGATLGLGSVRQRLAG
jgi:N-acetylglutamate synthase-like GNAT family acetyltransferase